MTLSTKHIIMDLQSVVKALKEAEEKAKALWEKMKSGERLTPQDIQFLTRELDDLEDQSGGIRFGGVYAEELLRVLPEKVIMRYS